MSDVADNVRELKGSQGMDIVVTGSITLGCCWPVRSGIVLTRHNTNGQGVAR